MEIQKKEGQDLKDQIDQFWNFFFVQQDFIDSHFFGESIEDTHKESDYKIKSAWEKGEDRILLKKKVYSVQPWNYQRFQVNQD